MKNYVSLFLTCLVSLFALAQTNPVGLQLNERAPDFAAKDQNGNLVSLSATLKKGPVVIVFYRGQWCPYCNRQLKGLQDSLQLIQKKGANLIAVSPEKLENVAKTVEKTKAVYPILFDEGLKIMKAYDVAFNVDDNTIQRYKKYGIDLQEVNGSNGATLPVPAVYIISQEGKLVFKHFDPDYRKRVTVEEILAHL